jgi:hypothetical protein
MALLSACHEMLFVLHPLDITHAVMAYNCLSHRGHQDLRQR